MSTSSGEEGKQEGRSSKVSILAPSKFTFGGMKGGGVGVSSSSSGFTGLKASKFNFGAPAKKKEDDDKSTRDANTKEEDENSNPPKSKSDPPEKESAVKAVSFIPLTKSNESSSDHLLSQADDATSTKPSSNIGFTFGENVQSRVEHSSSSSSGGFTFGENLKDRISNDTTGKEEKKDANDEDKKSNPSKESTTAESNYFKTSETTSSSSSSITDSSNSVVSSLKNGNQKSLSEAAADYEESHAVKRKYEEVAVKTGEEDESNVIQLPAKLHTFDNTKRNWSEKGRGILRLNDMDDTSRLVMRSVGVLKVILNTKLFPGMSWERPSEKSIRFSGADDEGAAKIFLLTGSSKDMERLFQLTKTRLNSLQNKKAKQSP